MKWRAALVGSAILSSCALGPKYKRPSVPVPDTYRGHAAPEEAAADLPWEDVFTDRNLQVLIRKALEQNKDLLLAAARVEEARAFYRIETGARFPEVFAGAAVTTRRDALLPSPLDDRQTYGELGVAFSWEIDVFGRLRSAREAARAEVFATEELRHGVTTALIADVARTYFELSSLDTELQITRRTAKSREDSLTLVRSREAAGLASLLDVKQAESALAETALQIPDLERQIAAHEHAISILLGENPGDVARGLPLQDHPVPQIPLGLPSSLLERRPDIRFAERELRAAHARVGVARAALFPEVSLAGLLDLQSTAIRRLVSGDALASLLRGNVSQILYDGGRRRGAVELAEARLKQALIAYEKAVQQSFAEVATALAAREKLMQMRMEQEKSIVSLRDADGLARIRYVGGLASYLEVLDTERQLFGAEIALVRIQRDQQVNGALLYRALGGGAVW